MDALGRNEERIHGQDAHLVRVRVPARLRVPVSSFCDGWIGVATRKDPGQEHKIIALAASRTPYLLHGRVYALDKVCFISDPSVIQTQSNICYIP